MLAVSLHAIAAYVRQGAQAMQTNAASTSPQTAQLRQLLNDQQAADLMGVGARSFADLIGQPWMPQPIILGARLRRWDADELLEALRTRAPRGGKAEMPAQLRRAKIEAMKAGATGQAAA
jgi:predicted DNA-binding transcriptional regulator AlpA